MFKPYYALLVLPLALAACSSDDDDDSPGTEASGSEEPTTPGTGANAPTSEGTYQLTFTNRSENQPMTPPVAVIHDPAVRLYEVGMAVGSEVRSIAEDGNIDPLVALVGSLEGNGVASSAVALSVPGTPGPLLPGESATVSLTSDAADQVLSVVSMVVCTNDGFTGYDSRALPETTETAFAAIYDAGSELNQLESDYWVPPCGGTGNLRDDENGVIALHPGQSGSETPVHDFAPGTEYLEVTVTRN